MKKEKSYNDYVYISVVITIIILITAYIVYILIGKPPIFNCIIYEKFGIYCPGCGCTRAFISLMNGKILASLYYNPTVLYTVVVLTIYVISTTLAKIFKKENSKYVLKYSPVYIYIGIFILIGTCIVKNILVTIHN